MALIKCMACGAAQPEERFRGETEQSCAACARPIRAILLPALYRGVAPPLPQPSEPPAPGEAVCFYDSNRRATKSCTHCGVFISDAWSAIWGSDTVCLKCLGELREKGNDSRFQAKRTLWDNVTLGISFGPWILALGLLCLVIGYPFSVMLIMLTIITAPAALFIGLRYWNAPRSLVPRSRFRLVCGLLWALLQIIFWVGGIIALIYAIQNGDFS